MGTSYYFCPVGKRQEDHPHAYGDKSPRTSCCNACSGSSPRVWGQVSCFEVFTSRFRIIPTRMGTRSAYNSGSGGVLDHPHAYGDKFIIRSRFVVSLGSSPRVWGQGLSGFLVFSVIRIIPTRMGTSFSFLAQLSLF